jgi:hypothetical protein
MDLSFVLQQGTQGLGFAIMEETRDGRHGIYVRHITIGGAAARVNICVVLFFIIIIYYIIFTFLDCE